jgi:hypothetical protein
VLGWSSEDVEQEIAAHERYVDKQPLGGVKAPIPKEPASRGSP